MSNLYSRPLHDKINLEHFLNVVLESDYWKSQKLINKILDSERGLKDYDPDSSTFSSKKFRDNKYRTDADRWKLRSRIVEELFEKARLDDDDKITLGKGGAKPKKKVKREAKAFIITGLPASGKSGVANMIADHYGAYILDSDYAKRKLPEYKSTTAGASLVHEESDAIIWGFTNAPSGFKSLVQLCSENSNINIVIPKIGHKAQDIFDLAKTLKNKFHYKSIHLTLVSLDRKKATNRAIDRLKRSSRYIPLSLIFDGYGNDPILAYYRLKNQTKGVLIGNTSKKIFSSFGKISTDGPKEEKPKSIDYQLNNPSGLFKKI